MEAFGATFFRPNVLALPLPEEPEQRDALHGLLGIARKESIGVGLLVEGPRGGAYQQESVNLWLDLGGQDWELSMGFPNQDLAILLAYKLHMNWGAELRLVARVGQDESEKARAFLVNLREVARLPGAKIVVAVKRSASGDPLTREGIPR